MLSIDIVGIIIAAFKVNVVLPLLTKLKKKKKEISQQKAQLSTTGFFSRKKALQPYDSQLCEAYLRKREPMASVIFIHMLSPPTGLVEDS